MAESPGILEFFAGRDVLVTGATGFMGKVLIEKLLRCCPEIRRVYIIVRPKRGVSPAARVEQMTKLAVFKFIKDKPEIMAKLCPLEGDMCVEYLGLRERDLHRVVEDVSVVFHMAASVNFNVPLKKAVDDNTGATKRMLDLACRMKNLVSFVHVSTAFCNCEQDVVEERIYTPRMDPHAVMRMCKELDDDTLSQMTPQLLGVHPNSYTFTKQLAEALVAEYQTKIPVSITRPSIVLPTIRDPMPGWVDSLNGPCGLVIAVGKGVVRSIQINPNAYMELIPVDICINVLILAAYRQHQMSQNGEQKQQNLPIYNVSSNRLARWTFADLFDHCCDTLREYPFQTVLWYPSAKVRESEVVHNIVVFLTQIVPAYFVDFILTLVGQKTFMVRLQSRISKELRALEYFRMRDWDFRNANSSSIWLELNERDKEIFFVNNAVPQDRSEYVKHVILGLREHMMKEPLENLPRSRRLHRILYVVHHTCILVFSLVFGWLFFRLLKFCIGSSHPNRVML